MSKIEELFKKEKQNAPTLSDNAKDRLFARVLKKEEIMHRPSFQARMRTWFVLPMISIGALAVAGFVVWYVVPDADIESVRLANTQLNLNISNINTVTPENTTIPAPKNTRVEELLALPIPDIAESLKGLGGGGIIDSFEWKIVNHIPTSAEIEVGIPLEQQFTDVEMVQFAESIGVYAAERANVELSYSGERQLRTDGASVYDCMGRIYAKEADQAFNGVPCASIHATGAIRVYTGDLHLHEDGWEAFYADVEALQGDAIVTWKTISSVITVQGATPKETITEYRIQPTRVQGDTALFMPFWHVVMRGETLIGYVGSIVPTQVVNRVSVVSVAEAVDRIRESFLQTSDSYGAQLLSTEIFQRTAITFTLTRSELLVGYVNDSTIGTLKAFPLYRFFGTTDDGMSVQWVVSADPTAFTIPGTRFLIDSMTRL